MTKEISRKELRTIQCNWTTHTIVSDQELKNFLLTKLKNKNEVKTVRIYLFCHLISLRFNSNQVHFS